jgi:hypothetical protein
MAAGKERVPEGRNSLPFIYTWKPRTSLAQTVSFYCLLVGFALTAFSVVMFVFFQGWLAQLMVPGLPGELLQYGLILLVMWVGGCVACWLYSRRMPFLATIVNQAVAAFIELGVIPEDLLREGFKYKAKTYRRKQVCVFMFSVRYPGRGFSDVMPMVRGVETAFPGATSCDLIETEGRAHKRYPLTLVVHYGGDDQ